MKPIRINPAELLLRLAPGEGPRPALDTAFVEPASDIERAVAGWWSTILNLRVLGVHDNFFALGGDSLQMTQVIARIRESYGVELSFDDFFDRPTIAELAVVIRKGSST